MSAHDNVTPAFPCEWDYINTNRANANGMTLRDYFAAKAVAALIAEPPWHQSVVSVSARLSRPEENDEAANFASAAYRIADAMLKERDK